MAMDVRTGKTTGMKLCPGSVLEEKQITDKVRYVPGL